MMLKIFISDNFCIVVILYFNKSNTSISDKTFRSIVFALVRIALHTIRTADMINFGSNDDK